MKNELYFFPCFALFALIFFTSCHKADVPDWETYTSHEHLYKIDYPIGWKTALDGHAFTVMHPGDSGLVSVTGYLEPGAVFDEPAFKKMVMLDFVECREKTAFAPVTGENWVGEDAVYERIVNGQKTMYLFRLAHRGQVGVFVAVSEMDVHLKAYLSNYKQMMDSLLLLTPPAEKYVGKYSPEDDIKKEKAQNRPWQEGLVDIIRATESKPEN